MTTEQDPSEWDGGTHSDAYRPQGATPHAERPGYGLGRDYSSRGDFRSGRHGEWSTQPGPGASGAAGGRAERAARGPKNWKRLDERIHDEVCGRLSMVAGVDVSEVSVRVDDGIVVLEGTVPQRRMKHLIEDVVDDCLGVRDIDNRLKVTRDAGTAAR